MGTAILVPMTKLVAKGHARAITCGEAITVIMGEHHRRAILERNAVANLSELA